MIDCGQIKVRITSEGPTHVRLVIAQDQPPGHLPKKLVELALSREELAAELKEAGI